MQTYKKTAFLMGTNIEIILLSDRNPLGDIYDAFGMIYSYELEFSRFLSHSTLSELNTSKKLGVSDRFIEIFQCAYDVYQLTGGYFNPLINPSMYGYSHSFNEMNFEIICAQNDIDISKIIIENNVITLGKNQNLDFGGIVKGYIVDVVRDFFFTKGYKNFIVNAGGDIYASGENNGLPWVIGIDNPFSPDKVFATIELKDASISTSGSYKRKWKVGEDDYHHIINPHTKECEQEMISISLLSTDTYITDTFATACFNMGIEKSLQFLAKHNIEGLILGTDQKMYTSKGLLNYNFKLLSGKYS